MLRVAFEAVMLASARHPELVPDGGLLERASVRVLVDSPWSSWEPIFDVAAAAPPCIQETYAVTLSAASATEQPSPPESDWLGSYLRDAVRRTRSSKRSLDVHRLATQAGVPTRVLERRLSALDLPDPESLPADDLTQIHGIGETFERVLKDLGYRTYDQIATLDQDDLQRISQRLGRHAGRLVKDGWIGQAQKLSGGE
jgi:predicted flap endonuclease-1-like 5' DNA nuclease